MPLHVHHAHRADLLVDALADVLAVPPADAFAREVVAVPSRGIERWIGQRLSHVLGVTPGRDDGVAADLTYPFPGSVISDAVARASGVDPTVDPWRPERLVWPLLDVVTEAVASDDSSRLGPLRVHVADGDGRPSDRRFAAVHRVAQLFDRYAVHRPAMLRSWAAGEDADPRGGGRLLPDRTRWQPRLWRAVRGRVTVASGPERLTEATAAIAAGRTIDGGPLDLELPDRLAVFGVSALSASTLEVLAALAHGPGPSGDPRAVHVFLRHPSPTLWRRTAAHLAELHLDAETLPARDADPTIGLARDPLLAAWGRDARELQLVASTIPATWHDRSGAHHDGSHDDGNDDGQDPVLPPDATLLSRLKEAVHHDRPRDATPTAMLADDDRSVQLHRCHGPARQVEVLRDLVLHLLAEDPTLEPRDVLVQCPDIETYAPLIEAVFGSQVVDADVGATGEAGLRVQLADRSLVRINPLLRVLAEVLDGAGGRLTASAVLDLCAREPVRRRFAFSEDDLGTLDAWLTSTGVRWGLDGDHRDAHGIPTDVNTWRVGLDRLLAGVAAADEDLRTVVGLVPEDDVEGDHVDLAGRFAELLSRLEDIVATLATPRPVGAWLEVLRRDVIGQLCAADPDAPWQEVGLDRALDELREAIRGADVDTGHLPLSAAELGDLLGDRLAGAPSRASHRTGDLTVCTLVPMRSVPHEVVVWLGMDDDVFPRRTVPDGDDLLSAAPLVGDRDPRTEDRQLLLDSLLSARRALVVLTSGHDERSGDQRPPAVPIGELLDTIDRTVLCALTDADGRPLDASAAVTVDHPLQPFDARRFAPGHLGVPGRSPVRPGEPFGFDRDDLASALAITGERHTPSPFLGGRLAPLDEGGQVLLGDVIAFLQHPAQALLVQRLDVRYPRDDEQRTDAIPVDVRGLAGWDVGSRLLEQVVAGHDPERWLAVERGRGTLPPGDLSDQVVADARTTVADVIAMAEDHGVPLGVPPEALPIDLTLRDGRRLVGSVPVVAGTRRHVRYSRLGRKHRLQAWVELLAVTACHPERPWRAVTLGRGQAGKKVDGRKAGASVSVLGPGPARQLGKGRKATVVANPLGDVDAPPEERRDRALGLLTSLVELRDRGLCGPLLLPCDTAGAYGETAWSASLGLSRAKPRNQAGNQWHRDLAAGFSGEDLDHANRLVLGELDIDGLLAIPPDPEEDGPGWEVAEPSRLGRLARHVWDPLLEAEEIRDR